MNIKKEWDKAMKEMEKFEPLKDFDLGLNNMESQFKDFKLDTNVKI